MRSLLLFTILFATKLFSQTTVYAVTPGGAPDNNRYYTFYYDKIFICDNCKEPFKNETSFEKYKAVIFTGDQIMIHIGPEFNINEKNTIIGYITDEKKILFGRIEMKGDTAIEIYDPTPLEEKNAPYTHDKKVFDTNGNIIAFIEGEEKYGAAWYLLTSKK